MLRISSFKNLTFEVPKRFFSQALIKSLFKKHGSNYPASRGYLFAVWADVRRVAILFAHQLIPRKCSLCSQGRVKQPQHFHNISYFISRYCMCLILPYIYTKSLWEIEKGFNLYTVYYQHRHKNFTKKLYSHSAAETESVESKHELRKYFVEKKSRSLWQSLFTFNLVTSNQPFFNLRHPINDEA